MNAPFITDFTERRVAKRKSLRVPVRVSIGDKPAFRCESIDISQSGMGMVGETNIVGNDSCVLEFALRQSEGGVSNFKISAKIAYCIYSGALRGFKIGAQFEGLDPTSAKAIRCFVKSIDQAEVEESV